GDTIAVEPSVARDILTDMLESSSKADIYLRTSVRRAIMDGDRMTGMEAERLSQDGAEKITFEARVFIDATERGDLLPLAGAAYRIGSSRSGRVRPEANVQDITYVAVVKKYPGGLPNDLKMPGPPPGYEKHVKKFRSVVTVSGGRWPGSYPFDIPTHNAYRALPDPNNDYPIVGDNAETWRFITKTCVNWANDFPGERGDRPGLSVMYAEDGEFRKKVEREAMNRTLSFLWYMQSELGMTDWSVDDSQGYGGWFSNDWQDAGDPLLPREFAPILRFFPPFPYVREGRRVIGVETLTDSDIKRDASRGRAYKNYSSSLALGEYPVDVHGSHLDRYMEHDLGESSGSFPKVWAGNQGVFQVPFGVFIPEKIDGLIAAEKNISVSRMVNGAIRLQPVTMHTGQAAGAIAAESVRSGVIPRRVNVMSVQLALMRSGQWIAADQCADADDEPYWLPVQWASLYEALPKIKLSKTHFGATLPIKLEELAQLLSVAFPGRAIGLSGAGDGKFISKGEFLRILSECGLRTDAASPDDWLLLSRGEAVRLVFGCAFPGML
ncbi:MAG: FAD-dependent oxidoreductase, partial [Synergistaceae bacterium]|nr:FAD-dependent oxidoreductase [Synergistaceae bacterium]